jgi:PhoH-like ATPase
MKKIYVFDTSVLLTDADCIFKYGKHDIVLPLKVLDEIDGKKKRRDGVGSNARTVIRTLDKLREKGSLTKGVRLRTGKGKLFVRGHQISMIPNEWETSSPDNMIIATAQSISNEMNRKVIVVTKDINMRVKCDSLNIQTEDYEGQKIIRDTNELYKGYSELSVPHEAIDMFYRGMPVDLDDDSKEGLHENEFLVLTSDRDAKKSALAMYRKDKPLKRLVDFSRKNKIQNLVPRNKEQAFALNALLDPEIEIVTLVGIAGTGKSLLALAAGLHQVLCTQDYGKMIVSKPVIPVGKDIGFLPGTLQEKMAPWLAPIKDNLEYLSFENGIPMEGMMNDGTIELEALAYIRGRSIANAFLLFDEVQNMTPHELKTVLTRVGMGSKIILTGDPHQVDNPYLDSTTNGLSHAVEKFKPHSIAAHITLSRGERSNVASLSAEIL